MGATGPAGVFDTFGISEVIQLELCNKVCPFTGLLDISDEL